MLQKNNLKSKLPILIFLPIFIGACETKYKFSISESSTLDSSIQLPNDVPSDGPSQIPTPEPTPAQEQPAPEIPTPVTTPTPTLPPSAPAPVFNKNSGNCQADSSTQLLSCMNCQVPTNPPPVPQLSVKGKNLLEVMSRACAIKNASDPKGYVPPTHEQLLARLNRASDLFYPESVKSNQQIKTIEGLLSSNSNLVQKMFSGLWYQPPFSDAFETYFGLEVGEARYAFCYNDPNALVHPSRNLSSVLMSKSYIDCLYSESSFGCKEQSVYNQANVYRKQLANALYEGIVNPWKPTPVNNPQHSCEFETLSGPNGEKMNQQVQEWLSLNQNVGAEVPSTGVCMKITDANQIVNILGDIKVAAYKCQ